MADKRSQFVTGLQKFACGHPDITPEDGSGYALCSRCGASVPVRLTAEMLEATRRNGQ